MDLIWGVSALRPSPGWIRCTSHHVNCIGSRTKKVDEKGANIKYLQTEKSSVMSTWLFIYLYSISFKNKVLTYCCTTFQTIICCNALYMLNLWHLQWFFLKFLKCFFKCRLQCHSRGKMDSLYLSHYLFSLNTALYINVNLKMRLLHVIRLDVYMYWLGHGIGSVDIWN